MPDVDLIPYDPTQTFNNVNNLYSNHFRFTLLQWPDVSFDVQTVTVPNVTSHAPEYPNPFTVLPQTGDHLKYGTFDVVYLMDKQFKSYFSLYYWMRGYGFPHSYDEVTAFLDAQRARSHVARPQVRELEKTTAVLSILQPDTNSIIAEIVYDDVFPVALGELNFETNQSAPNVLTGRVTFVTSDFHVRLTS